MLLKKVIKKYKYKYRTINGLTGQNLPKFKILPNKKNPAELFLEGLWPHFFKQACVDIGEITYNTKNLRKFQLICCAHSSRPTRAATFELNDQLLKFTRVL